MRRLAAPLLLLMLLGCGGADFVYFESITSGPNPGATLVVVWMSDAPADDAEALEVAVRRVELVGPAGSVTLASDVPTFDLLALQNGARLRLARREIEPASFDRVRITLVESGASAPRVRRGGVWQPLGFVAPSAHVVEIPYAVQAQPDTTLEIHVDFNARTSLRDTGSDLELDPQLEALDPSQAGGIAGAVRSALGSPLAGAVVVARQQGAEVRSTRTRADGTYTLTPLLPGSYDISVDGPAGPVTTLHDLAVAAGQVARGDLQLTP